MTAPMPTDTAYAALWYVEHGGWAVLPLHGIAPGGACTCGKSACPSPGKHPRTPCGVKNATRNLSEIDTWWRRWPDANVGIATGSVSGGLFVLDIDPRHEGNESLVALEQRHGALPVTLLVSTGGGGQHLYFSANMRIPNSAGRLGPGLDVRGEGGYVVAPPSVHASGRPYEWPGHEQLTRERCAPAPSWLVRLVVNRPRACTANASRESWRHYVTREVAEGARNATMAKIAGHLLRLGVDPYVTLGLLECWNAQRCRPPLGHDEVVRVVDSIAGRELHRRAAGGRS